MGHVPEARWSHGSCAYGSKMVIFGGINDMGFVSGDVYELETDEEAASCLLETFA